MTKPITKRYIKRFQGYERATSEIQSYMDGIERLDGLVREYRELIHRKHPGIEEIRLILTRLSLKEIRNRKYHVINESFGKDRDEAVQMVVSAFSTLNRELNERYLDRLSEYLKQGEESYKGRIKISGLYIKSYLGYADAPKEVQQYMDLVEEYMKLSNRVSGWIRWKYPVIDYIREFIPRLTPKMIISKEYEVLVEAYYQSSRFPVTTLLDIFGKFQIQNGLRRMRIVFEELDRIDKVEKHRLAVATKFYKKGYISKDEIATYKLPTTTKEKVVEELKHFSLDLLNSALNR